MDIAVLVNLRARRGSEVVARLCRSVIPGVRVKSSSSLDEAQGFARSLQRSPPNLVVSAGGDGTAVALLNAMRSGDGSAAPTATGNVIEHPILGVLPLGTGNGWASATGAPRWRAAVRALGRLATEGGEIPLQHFELIETCGVTAPFAGTGWDAEIIDDFHAQKEGFGVLPKRARQGLAGYMVGLTTRTIPRHVMASSRTEVELTNLGEEALIVDDNGRAVPLEGAGPGTVLYRGPMSVCGASTTPLLGFNFRAFPFAGLVPRRFCMRVYAGSVYEATMRMPSLWRGVHPLPNNHTFMLTRCKAVFSRPVPFQVGGDRIGWKTEIEYALARQPIDLLNWRGLRGVA